MSYQRLTQLILKVLSLMVIGSAMAQDNSSENLPGVSSGDRVIQEHREKHADRKDRFKERRGEYREKHADRKDQYRSNRSRSRVQKSGARVRTAGHARKARR